MFGMRAKARKQAQHDLNMALIAIVAKVAELRIKQVELEQAKIAERQFRHENAVTEDRKNEPTEVQ